MVFMSDYAFVCHFSLPMHDGKYCLVSDHQLYTTFRDALWDTLNPLYRV